MERSHLARLPQELRDLIYNFTFATSYAVTLKSKGIQHPLTQTCRRVRDETLALYLGLTRFNAHLDDGPATPLADWLQAMGPDQCLLLREVNIWDMHMLNGTLHGVKAAEQMLIAGPNFAIDDEDAGGTENEGGRQNMSYVLKPVGRDIFRGSWYLAEIVLALQNVGLGLLRFCEIRDDDKGLKQTSHFAIRPFNVIGDADSGLVGQFGLDDSERSNIYGQLDEGKRMIQLQEGRRNISLAFDDGRKLIGLRQQFIPRDEEFYM